MEFKMTGYIKPTSFGQSRAGECNDCTVRALANTGVMSYDAAFTHMKDFGRSNNRGANQSTLFSAYEAAGYKAKIFGTTRTAKAFARTTGLTKEKGMTVKTMLQSPEYKGKTFIAVIKGHAFAVVNGGIVDTSYIKENSRVTSIFMK
jgi:hypothetical protein